MGRNARQSGCFDEHYQQVVVVLVLVIIQTKRKKVRPLVHYATGNFPQIEKETITFHQFDLYAVHSELDTPFFHMLSGQFVTNNNFQVVTFAFAVYFRNF